MKNPVLKIQLLGTFAVWVNGEPIPRLRTRKGQALLAHLVLKHPAAIQRDWVAGALWPDSLEEQGRLSLRQSLNDLRKSLGEEGDRILSPSSRTLGIDLEGAQADVLEFVANAQSPAQSPTDLLRAISLYQGHLLEGVTEESLQKPAEELKNLFLAAIDSVTPHLLQTDQLDALIPILKRGAQCDPLKESFVRNLMLALAKQDDFAELTQVYRELRLRLEQNLRISPSPETTALYQKLREVSQQKRAGTTPSTPYSAPASTATAEPATRSNAHTLPRPLIQIVGREEELAEVKRLVMAHPLVTVLGMGGIGKTRLAHQAGYSLQCEAGESFCGGIWQVNLASLTAQDMIPLTILSSLGRKPSSSHSLEEELLAALQEEPTLLILDNCEHLMETLAKWVEWLLENCPKLHILATSRETFGITGERAFTVSPLSLPRIADTKAPQTSPAVALWVERARQHRPDFELTADNAELVATICRHLDGIPLAIELAAARLNLFNLSQIEERLNDRFRLLVGGSRTSLPHHKTLRATIDGSYDLLNEEERVLFRRMSVFRGGCTLEALEAVCGMEETLSPLSRLIDRSLVLAEEEENGERRFRMLETLREYALEKLDEAQEKQEFQERQFQWCLEFAQTGQPKIQGAEGSQWLPKFEAEHDNLRFAIQNAPSNNQKYQLLEALVRFWHYRGYLYEGQRWIEQALENQNSVEAKHLYALLNSAGMFCMLNTDYPKAIRYFENCIERCAETGDTEILALVHNNIGNTLSDLRQPEEAQRRYNLAIEYARKNNQKSVLARVLSNLGGLATEAHQFEEGLRYYQESSEIRKEINDIRGVAFIDMCMGASEHGRKRYSQAFDYYKRALRGYQKLSDLYNIMHCINYVAALLAEARQAEFSVALLGAVDSLLSRYEMKLPISMYNDTLVAIENAGLSLNRARHTELHAEGSAWTLEATIARIFAEEAI